MLRLVGVYSTLGLSIRPSNFIGLPEEDEYTCYCFDEAFAFVLTQLKNGEQPVFSQKSTATHYSKPSDLYKKYGGA